MGGEKDRHGERDELNAEIREHADLAELAGPTRQHVHNDHHCDGGPNQKKCNCHGHGKHPARHW